MLKKRIVFTGVGDVSSIGAGKKTYWEALKVASSGLKPITLFGTEDFKTKVAFEITDFNAKELLGKRTIVDLDRATTLLLVAVKFALEDSQLEINIQNTFSTAICVGTTFGSLHSLLEFDKTSLLEGPRFVNPSHFPNVVMNSPASRVAIRFGIKGFNTTISTGFCASLDALDYAVNAIHSSKANCVIVGAVEDLSLQSFLGFYHLGYLSGSKDSQEVICCPFDQRRNGIVLGEGSGVVILEELETARKRGASIYGEILGIGSNFDPYRMHKFNPRAEGMKGAMESALEGAQLGPQDIDCIFAHANSAYEADLYESKAIQWVFRDHINKLPVTSIKSMVGETFSTGGMLSLIASLGAIHENFIPPILNYEKQDPYVEKLNFVTNTKNGQKIDKVLINSFSPNGENTCVVIGRYPNE